MVYMLVKTAWKVLYWIKRKLCLQKMVRCCPANMKVVLAAEEFYNRFYYMDKGILLATKKLVESIRHYILDPSGVFSVCHAREWYIDRFPPFLLLFFFKMADEFKGLWS